MMCIDFSATKLLKIFELRVKESFKKVTKTSYNIRNNIIVILRLQKMKQNFDN